MKKIDNFNFVGNATTKNLNLNFTLMYTPIQLSAIRLFGRKDLTEGCIVFQPEYDYAFKIPEDELKELLAENNPSITH